MMPAAAICFALLLGSSAVAQAQDAGVPPESEWCPFQRDAVRSAEQFKAANSGNPRMAEIDQAVVGARKALDACLRESRDVKEHGTRDQQLHAQAVREIAEREQQEAADQKALDDLRRDPKFIRMRLSALLCYQAGERRKYQGRIDEQKRGARIGGVIDKEQVYEAQQEIVAMDRLGESIKRSLKSARIKPMDCRRIAPEKLEDFISCIDGKRNDSIDDPADESVSQIMTASEPCAAEGGF